MFDAPGFVVLMLSVLRSRIKAPGLFRHCEGEKENFSFSIISPRFCFPSPNSTSFSSLCQYLLFD
jgi:hypothetical protein